MCNTTHRTVKRAVRQREEPDPPVEKAAERTRNYDIVAGVVAAKVRKTKGRISAKRLLPEARAAGYTGSARNFRRLVFRPDLPAIIDWRCSACGDEGVISGWEGSYFDLRRPRSQGTDSSVSEVPVTDEVCATLRDLRLLDSDCERLVFGVRATTTGIVLVASEEDLEELLGYVAAEANHESNRRRQKCLDLAFTVLSDALKAMGFLSSGGER
jgi:hypothetical protein